MAEGKKNALNRREFMKTVSVTALGAAGVMGLSQSQSAGAQENLERRNEQPGMKYRRLGRTNLMVSEVGFGAMFITAENAFIIEKAFDMGINYFDTAWAYTKQASETELGKIFKGSKRDKIFLTTKASPFLRARNQALNELTANLSSTEKQKIEEEAINMAKEEGLTNQQIMAMYITGRGLTPEERQLKRQAMSLVNPARSKILSKMLGDKLDRKQLGEVIENGLNESLARLQTDHVDIFFCPHGSNNAVESNLPEVFEAWEKIRKAGKARFLAVPSHRGIAEAINAAVDTGKYDVVMPWYNALSEDDVKDAVARAKKADVGVVAMKGSGGARRPESFFADVAAKAKGQITDFQKAFRYILDDSNVSAVLIGTSNMSELEENIKVPNLKLSKREKEEFKRLAHRNAAAMCAACGSCASACPNGVAVPDIMRFRMYANHYGERQMARDRYAELPIHEQAACCSGCGTCEQVCPRALPIRRLIAEAHKQFV